MTKPALLSLVFSLLLASVLVTSTAQAQFIQKQSGASLQVKKFANTFLNIKKQVLKQAKLSDKAIAILATQASHVHIANSKVVMVFKEKLPICQGKQHYKYNSKLHSAVFIIAPDKSSAHWLVANRAFLEKKHAVGLLINIDTTQLQNITTIKHLAGNLRLMPTGAKIAKLLEINCYPKLILPTTSMEPSHAKLNS